MFSTILFYLASYWLAWTNLFPSLPLWSPHGAVMLPIVASAVLVLAGKYLMSVVNRA